MVQMPTIEDLFGGVGKEITYYRDLFPRSTAIDGDITDAVKVAFLKVEPVFGEFREYEVGEETVRNEHVKRAVCFEAESIILSNPYPINYPVSGGVNTNDAGSGKVLSEKLADVSTTYSEGGTSKTIGLGDDSLAYTLGLLSKDASILLSRYIRKTYGMGREAYLLADPDQFPKGV